MSDPTPAAENARHGYPAAEPAQPGPVALSVPSEEAMYDLLNGLNVTGETCELPCTMIFSVTSGRTTWHAAPFLATLTDPDADHVNYIASDESGRSRCESGCDECGSDGPTDWTPKYPVWALVGVWPDAARCREDDIPTWWLPVPPGSVRS